MIGFGGLRLLTAVLNRLVAANPEAEELLLAMEGKCLDLYLRLEREYGLRLVCERRFVYLTRPDQHAPDTRVVVTAAACLRLLGDRNAVLAPDQFVLQGAPALLQQWRQLLQIPLPWEDMLSRRVGDPMAVLMVHLVTALRRWLQQRRRALCDDGLAFLRHEQGILADSTAVAQWTDEVDDAALVLEDLEARLALR